MTKLQEKIKLWEAEALIGDGDSYAPVSSDDETLLYDIVMLLLESRYIPDGDGDYPLDFTWRDKNNYSWLIHPIYSKQNNNADPLEKIQNLSQSIKELSSKLEREFYCYINNLK